MTTDAPVRIPAIEIPLLISLIVFAILIIGWFAYALNRHRRRIFEDENFKRFAAAFAALVAVLTANITYLQSDASTVSDRYARDAQRSVVQAMGLRTSSQAQIGYGLNTAQNWYELGKLAGSARREGDGDASRRYLAVQRDLGALSPLLSPTYTLDLRRYESDVYVQPATALMERYAVASGLSDAWGAKGQDYITLIALLAVVLFLLGLSTAIAGRVRALFFGTALAIFGISTLWMAAVLAQPIDTLRVPAASIDQYARGVALAHQRKYADAVSTFDQAIEKAPSYANAYYERGLARQALKAYAAAVADFKAARAYGRDDAGTAWNEGWAHYLAGAFDEAVRADRRALEFSPDLIPVRANLGLALLAAGRLDEAEHEYTALMEQATQETAEARRSGNTDLPYTFWASLDTASRDLQSLLDQLDGGPRAWTEAPPRETIASVGTAKVKGVAQDLYAQLRSLSTALELTGQPPAAKLTARVKPFQFSLPFGRGGGGGGGAEPSTPFEAGTPFDVDRKIYYPTFEGGGKLFKNSFPTPAQYVTDTFAYSTDLVVIEFEYDGMRDGQTILWKGYMNGMEDLSLRRVETWTLGASSPVSSTAQRIITFMFAGAGDYAIEAYVDGQLAQRGSFTILPKAPVAFWSYDEQTPSTADNSLALDERRNTVQRIGKGVLNAATWSPDGHAIGVASALGIYLHRVDVLTGTAKVSQTAFLPTDETVGTFAFSPDGKRLAVGHSKEILVLDAGTGETLLTLPGHEDYVNSVAFSPDGARIASGSADTTVKLWGAQSGKLLQTLQGHTGAIGSVAFSPDSAQLVSASRDNTAIVWDAASGEVRATLEGHTLTVNAAAFSPDGTRVATASADRTIKLWDAQSGMLLLTLAGHTDAVNTAVFRPDGRQLLSSSADRSFIVWDARSGKVLATRKPPYFQDNVVNAEYSPDGRALMAVSWDNTIQFFTADKVDWKYTLRGYPDYLNSVAFSPDGAQVLTAGRDRRARLWDASTGALLDILSGHGDTLYAAVFSPDGARVATASADETLRLWSAGTGGKLFELSGHTGPVYGVAYSPDNLRVASAGDDGTVRVWAAASGELLNTLEGHNGAVLCVAFEPAGNFQSPQWLASGGVDKTIRLWQMNSGDLKFTLSGHTDAVLSIAFSPDGQQLVSGGHDGRVKLWDVQTGKLIRDVAGLDTAVHSVAFSPDGQQIASGTADNRVIVWSGTDVLHEFTGHASIVTGVAFKPDGKHVVSVSQDGTVRFWDLN